MPVQSNPEVSSERPSVIPAPPPSTPGSSGIGHYDFYKVIQEYLDRAAKVIQLEPYIKTILSQPKNEIMVNFPVRMDNGEVRLFKGYRVQHNNLLGPFKGGMRYHPSVTLDDVKALSAMMTWKSSLMRLPFGGGKGGIKFNPHAVSRHELQKITRRFTHALSDNMVGSARKQSVKGVVTGKPVASGGTLGRESATGQGLVYCIIEWAKERVFSLEGATMSVQGFGNVGSNTAVILSRLGVATVAVGDHTGYLYNPEGFNAHKLQDYVEANGSIAGYPGGKPITREDFFATKVDIFAPCALENQIGEAEAQMLSCKLIVEGANGPTNPAGEKILLERGVELLPDVLANSGGVTVSYYEWVQNKRSESWTAEEVDERLEIAMKRAYRDVSDFARNQKVDLRIAAYGIALQRLAAVYKEREIFP